MSPPSTTLALAAATLLTIPAPAAAQDDPQAITWGVVPAGPDGPDGRTAFDYKLDPGAVLVDHVAVSNHSTEQITVTVYASDAFTTTDGGFDLLPAAEPPTDVGSWITLDSSELTIPGRSRAMVPFELSVPENATPGDHAGGLVASLTTVGTDDSGDQVQVEHRVGARIYLRVTGELSPHLTVASVDAGYAGTLNPFGGGTVTATFTVRNTGNVRLAGQPRLTVSGPFGLGRRSIDAAEPLPEILPGGAVTATVRLPGVAPLVRLDATVDPQPVHVDEQAGPAPLATDHRTPLWAPPWGQAALLVLVAAAVTWWWWLRRRHKRRFEEAVAAAVENAKESTTPEPVAKEAT